MIASADAAAYSVLIFRFIIALSNDVNRRKTRNSHLIVTRNQNHSYGTLLCFQNSEQVLQLQAQVTELQQQLQSREREVQILEQRLRRADLRGEQDEQLQVN